LLAFGAPPDAVQAFRDAAAASNGPLTVIEAAAEGEAARYEASLVLVRPDQFVAWSTREVHIADFDAAQILKRVAGAVEVRAEVPTLQRSR
jgi:hypothetical protein